MTRSISLAILAFLTGCSSRGGRIDTDGATSDPIRQLEAETGHSWSVRWHEDVHTPAFLEGRTAPMAVTADDAARTGRDFLLRHATLFSIGPSDDVDTQESATDELGMTHARFVQKVDGHPVWGGELLVHFDGDGALVRVNGRYVPIGAPLPPAVKTEDEARVLAVAEARRLVPSFDPDAYSTYAPKLYVYPVEATDAKLAWRVEVTVADATVATGIEVFVDAVDGTVVASADLTQTLDGSGIGVFGDEQALTIAPNGASFILEDATRGEPPTRTYTAGGTTRLPGTAVRSADPNEWDADGVAAGAAVDAHAYVAAVWDYFLRTHRRAGWDGNGKGVHTTVHYGQRYANAFFNGRQLVFGDGDGTLLSPLAGALDVVAHEFTHGVTAHSARLVYQGQSGALNEAISDIFGCFVEGNWQIGEAVYHPGGRARPMRDVAHPHETDNPQTMEEYVVGPDDHGGVHVNSTIASHAAYLMTQGPNRLPVATVEKIWYRALVRYLHARAKFRDAADATLAAARDLGSNAEETVRDAWRAVGVL
jgi:bacillolysin